MNQFKFSFTVLLVLSFAVSSIAGSIHGSVKSTADQSELAGANVVIIGTKMGASTDLTGEYFINNLPAGSYSVKVTMLGYQEKIIDKVVIGVSESLELNLLLIPASIELEDVTVEVGGEKGSVEAELIQRMENTVITDAISSEVMKSLPDPDVSQVVRRATGVSTMGGEPVIRGLGLRYSKVTMNNSQIAGTEPNRSSVSLELFPTTLMQQVTVSKSYSADQFGEFGGGVIDMNTWEFPGDPILNMGLSLGFNQYTTFQDFSTYNGGHLDYFGFDDGTRSLPDAIQNSNTKVVEQGWDPSFGFTSSELEAIGESFPNVWSPQTVTALPNLNFNWSYARNTTLFGRKLGYLVSNIFRNGDSRYAAEHNIYHGGAGDQIELWHSYDFDYFENKVTLGGISAFKYRLSPFSTLNLSIYYNREANDEVRYFAGWNDDRGKIIQDTRLRYVEQTTFSTQLSGDHIVPYLNNAIINWHTTFSRGTRYEPDTREVQYEADPGETFVLADESQSGSRLFGWLYDNMFSAGVNMIYWLNQENKSKLKSGLAFITRHRDSETRFFQFEPRDDNQIDITQSPEAIFAPENIDSDGFMISEYTRPTDSYNADQHIGALYVMTDIPLREKLRLSAGVRFEQSLQQVTSYELFTASAAPVEGKIDNFDVLPSMTMVYTPKRNMNLRLAASQTVSRPDFRELSEFEFTDIIGGHAVVGNPNLERALIRHADLRWEYTTGESSLLSVSVFYKYFVNPIEVVIQPTAQNRVSYENAESADNYGVEFEVRHKLGSLMGVSFKDFAISSNLTLLKSEINLSDSTKGIQTSSRRPLHGQSPYLFNLGLNYRNPAYKIQVDLFYNIFGKRIAEVGSKPLPDIYEMPHPDLDLSVNQPLDKRLNLKLGVSNILNSQVKFKQGDYITESYRKGRTYSIGLSYNP